MKDADLAASSEMHPEKRDAFIDEVARQNVLRTVQELTKRSAAICTTVDEGKVLVVGATLRREER